MKLRRLRIENFKRFRDPLSLDGFADGLNLFAAPNESGKSTLAEAIRAAFFERHRSGSVEHLRPWGDANATPMVELEFEIGAKHYRLCKAFLGRKRCDLTIEGEPALDGVAAEDHLARVLGFKFAGKGASTPEHMGIPGLLWVRQSTAHQLADAVSHASDHLRHVLGESLGELTSSSGDALLREVEAARNELLTPSAGKHRGEYDAALRRKAELTAKAEQMSCDIIAYRESVDRLAALRSEYLRDEQARPWAAIHRELQNAIERFEVAQGLEARQAAEQASVRQWTMHAASLRAQLESFGREEAAVAARARGVEAAVGAEATAQAGLDACERRHRDVLEAEARARGQLDRVRAAFERAELLKSAGELDASLSALADTLARAREQRARLTHLQAEAGALAVPAADLKKLTQLSESLRETDVRLDAVATSLEFELLDGRSLRIGGQTITGRARRTVLSRTGIEIDGVGTIAVSPGGEHLDQLAAQRDTLSGTLDALLRRLGVPSVAEAHERARQAEQRLRDAKTSRELLEILAPKGVEALEADLAARTARLAELRAAIAGLPSTPDDDPPLPARAAAQADAERAKTALDTSAGALSQARVTAAKAQSDHVAARQELAAAMATLNVPERAQRMAAAQHALSDALAQEAVARQRAEHLDAELKNVNLSLLRQDVERLTSSARQIEDDHKRLGNEIVALEAELRSKGALGLEEQRSELERDREAASRRADELARRADALDHLLGLMREKRSALARRLRAPLQRHLDRYLQILFPGARIEVADDLSPGAMTRIGPHGPESGEFEQLSLGTREQMGIVARLAYADLLQEAGKPTLLILDDALVNSDEQRLGQMKRVLYDAAQRHQVLIFTCHPAAWRDLGVMARSIGP